MVITAIYLDGGSKNHYIKKFNIETTTINKKFPFIGEAKGSKLLYVSGKENIKVAVETRQKSGKLSIEYQLDELVSVKGWKAAGNRFEHHPIVRIKELSADEPVLEPLATKMAPVAREVDEADVVYRNDPKMDETPEPEGEKSERVVKINEGATPTEQKANSEDDTTYHAGDSVEMKIDLDKIKKGKDQLGLFD